MAAVSETIVREYFELHGFLVRQPRKHIVRTQREEDGADLLVLNPLPRPSAEGLPFVLTSEHLSLLTRAALSGPPPAVNWIGSASAYSATSSGTEVASTDRARRRVWSMHVFMAIL